MSSRQMIVRRQYRRPMSATAKFQMAKKAITYGGKLYRSLVKRKPSRNVAPIRRTRQTRRVERVLKNFSGGKYQGYTAECLEPDTKPAGNQPISYIWMNSGKDITGVGGSYANYIPMNLFAFPQGDANDERVGDYMFIRQSRVKFEIQTLPINTITSVNGQQPVIQFRFMVLKSNRKYDSLGQTEDPGNSVFLDTQNGNFGYGIPQGQSDSTTFLNFSAPINKRDWIVYCDKRFKLSAPSSTNTASGAERVESNFPKYNTKKYIGINLPVHKKCYFQNSQTAEDNVPVNLDTQWLVIVQAVHGSYCASNTTAPRNWRMNVVGTTSAYDN